LTIDELSIYELSIGDNRWPRERPAAAHMHQSSIINRQSTNRQSINRQSINRQSTNRQSAICNRQ
jgi:hypothetical protein